MFSEGGLTSPDIWIVITIIVTASISILLNPLVFRDNIRKKRSIARDLYMALSATDFFSSIVLSAFLCQRILQPIEEQCIKDKGATFCQTEYYKYTRTATTAEKVVESVKWSLMYAPITITSVLAFSRWYQISYPLRVLNRNALEMILTVWCICQVIYSILTMLIGSPTLMTIYIQSVIIDNSAYMWIDYILVGLQSFLSIVAALLTIWSVVKSQNVSENREIRARRTRSTIRIMLLNAGSIAYFGVIVGTSNIDRKNLVLGSIITVAASVCLLPILQSAYNPVIYTLLTKGIFNSNSRVRAGN